MRVTLVCKKELDGVTLRQEYPFVFDSSYDDGTDGYIIEDDKGMHWLTLPSNCHKRPEGSWKSSDYFAEVVHDPEH